MSFTRKAVRHIAALVVFGLPLCAFAVDVVYEPTPNKSVLEAQGFNGRIDLPVTVSLVPSGHASVTPLASAGNATDLYTLIGNGSTLVTSNTQTGAYLGQVTLPSPLSDIAYTNGQLYGISASSNTLQVVSIAANGSTQPVFTQSISNSNPWRISGVVNGDALLVTGNGQGGYVIDPATGQETSTLLVPSTGSQSPQTVINAAGNLFTVMGGNSFAEPTATFPGGVAQGNRPGLTGYSNNTSVSDEFTIPYQPSQAAVAQVSASSVYTGAMDGLIRNPQVINFSTNISLSNGVAPDGTALSNVTPVSLSPTFIGPTTPTYQQTLSSPGNFAAGTSLGQLNVTLNLAGAQRGVYTFLSQPTLTADYAYGNTVDHGRAVQSYATTIADFAYDPASANLVGNGDASLQSAGWESQFANLGWQNDSAPQDPITHGFDFLPLPGDAYAIRQFLQLPTPNSAMMLTFSDHLVFNGSATVQVFLNNILVATVTDVSESSAPQQFLINNPALENLSNAPLMFSATLNGSSLTQVEIDNITLTAVPEPGVVSVMILGAMLINGHRRWR